jgi:hypothetical protein
MAGAEPSPRARRGYLPWLLACVAGLMVLGLSVRVDWPDIVRGLNDFPAFYVAPQMLATGDLYHTEAFLARQQQILGISNPVIIFVRLPFVAVMLAPLSRLPYLAAYAIWQALSLAALAIFVLLWPVKRALAFAVCCWFPPLAANFDNAQDVTWLLLWVAFAAWLCGRGKDFAAGLVLALCLAKPHLFLLLPAVVIARRMWNLAAGFAAGAVALLALSFAAAGTGWPADFLRTIRNPAVNPSLQRSSVLAAIHEALSGPLFWCIAAMLVIALALVVYRISLRRSLTVSLATALAAGPIVGLHVYRQDYLLVLPLILILIDGYRSKTTPAEGKIGNILS